MPKLALTSSLDQYQKLKVSDYKDSFQDKEVVSVQASHSYQGKALDYQITVDKTPCNYGGYRYWWLCPQCGKRASVLYMQGKFVCRHCIGLGYQSQLEQPLDRIYRRIWALKRRLGASIGSIEDVPPRPKGMHQSTYNKLVNEHIRLAEQITQTQLQI